MTSATDDWFLFRYRAENSGGSRGYFHVPEAVNVTFSDGSVKSITDRQSMNTLITYYSSLGARVAGICSTLKVLTNKKAE